MSAGRQARRVVLLVDNPFRDLPGMVLVARALAHQGVCVMLAPVNLRNSEIWPLVPDFVLLNHLRRTYGSMVRELMHCGVRVGVLDTEGGVFTPAANTAAGGPDDANHDLDPFGVTMVQEADIRQAIMPFCAWSPRFAAHAAARGWFSREQLVVTGVPRMDFYAAPWSVAALKLEPAAEAFAHNLILINGSFPVANAAFDSAEKECDMLSRVFGYAPEFGTRLLAAQREGMAGLTALANHLAQAMPHATFVYRPHPFERESVYRTLLAKLPNLHLVKQGTVNGWLLRAKALIQHSSSTAIEAALAGIPAFGAGWLPAFPPVPSSNAVTVHCADEAELRVQLETALAGRYVRPPAVHACCTQIVERTFYRIDGCAHARVADAIIAALARPGPRPSRHACWALTKKDPDLSFRDRLALHRSLRANRRYQAGGIKEALQRASDWDTSPKQFAASDVRRIVDAIDAVAVARGDPARILNVADARSAGAYVLMAPAGRSVVLQAA